MNRSGERNFMKLIIAVVRPFTIDRLVVALEEIENFPGMTVTEADGFERKLKNTADTLNPFKPYKRIEIAAPDELVEQIVAAIRAQAHTGKKGDGVILLVPLEQIVAI